MLENDFENLNLHTSEVQVHAVLHVALLPDMSDGEHPLSLMVSRAEVIICLPEGLLPPLRRATRPRPEPAADQVARGHAAARRLLRAARVCAGAA